MTSIAEALVAGLAARGVDCIFGIPGVHTVELYRGLAASGIRHVTPRHEQGAGFMADGYARVSGRPGVAFVITGPGVTNTLTAMGQARADSVPMLVVSGVNARASLGRGLGHLHELPDQRAMMRTVALMSERIEEPGQLGDALDRAFAAMLGARPGPVHIEIPLDVAGLAAQPLPSARPLPNVPLEPGPVAQAAAMLNRSQAPVILVGGGARSHHGSVRALAERLDAPVVQTVNARGVMFGHPLGIPASPSLTAVRDLIAEADTVLALGTELGPTDFDMYGTGTMPAMQGLIRIDICAEQLARRPADLAIRADAGAVLAVLAGAVDRTDGKRGGAARAERARKRAWEEIGPEMRSLSEVLAVMRDAVPGATMVGDSAQPIYAGNLYYDHDRPGGWFNAATGFGALGYAIPAAVGAAMAAKGTPVLCITGDGGAQFSLPELMCAVDEKLPITFVIFNNHGYQEIATSMQAAGVSVVGCDPTPPDFELVAQSCGVPFSRVAFDEGAIGGAVRTLRKNEGPAIVEITAPNLSFPR